MKRFWRPWGIILVTALVSMLTPGVFYLTLQFLSPLIEAFQRQRVEWYVLPLAIPSLFVWIWDEWGTYLEFTFLAAIPAIASALNQQRINRQPLSFISSLLASSLYGVIIAVISSLFFPVYENSNEVLQRFIPSLLFGFVMGLLVNYNLNSHYWPPKAQQEPPPQPPN